MKEMNKLILIMVQLAFIILITGNALATPSESKMYWVDSYQNAVLRANLDGSNIEEIVSGAPAPFGIAVDPINEYIFWSDNITDSICRVDLDGQNQITIVTGLVTPNHLAVDNLYGKIYWTDRNAGKVQRANLDGSNVEDIVTELISPRGIGVDANSGLLYFIDTANGAEGGAIYCSNLDGTGLIPLIPDLPYPFSMTLDLVHEKIYWAEITFDKLRSANLDGSNIQDLINSGLSAVTGIDVNPCGYLYFTDFSYDQIFRCRHDGSDFESVLATDALPNDIALYIVNTPPVALCQDVTVFADDDCQTNASINGDSYDLDDDLLTFIQNPSGPYTLGVTEVALTVEDCLETDTCTAIVTVLDITAPTITCPANLSIECDEPTDPSTTCTPTATDNCDATLEISYDDENPTQYEITRTWTATDDAGNQDSCVQTITVVDTTAPIVSCNAVMTIIPSDAPISFSATATDACDEDVDVVISEYNCWWSNHRGKIKSKMDSCVVEVEGNTITILNAGGVDDNITWTVVATDDSGNSTTEGCALLVVNPAH